MDSLQPDKEFLLKLAHYKMPYGKYKGNYLVDIPEYYYVWFLKKGFPKGQLGMMMQQMYEIKLNGLEHLIHNIKNNHQD